MKTKKFRVATAGSTIDGREITDQWLEDMANSYNPATYAARVNVEHIDGMTPDGPFRCFGEVLELETADVEVDFNGKPETRKALYAVLDINDDGKKLHEQGQKLYPSISVEQDFCGKGFSYLDHLALTSRPAAIATEKMQFSFSRPSDLVISSDDAYVLEFAEAAEEGSDGKDGIVSKFTAALDNFGKKFGGGNDDQKNIKSKSDGKGESDQVEPLDFSELRPLLETLGADFSKAVSDMQANFRREMDELTVKFSKLQKDIDETADPNFTQRPPANGPQGDAAQAEF